MALVLVTGATGKIGVHLVRALAAKGDSVRAVVRSGSGHSLPSGVEKIECDLASEALPKAAFEGIDKIVHAAGLVAEGPYSALVGANSFAVKNLLCNCPAEAQKIVALSSIAVYGECGGQLVDESFPTKPDSDYGKSKLLGETFAREYCGTLPIIFLRPAIVYGPGFEDGFFPVLDYIQRGKMKIIGNGKNRVPLVHVLDVVQAILLALEASSQPCREYNIAGIEQPSQSELLTMAAQELGVAPPSEHVSVGMAKFLASAKSSLSSFGLGKKPRVSAMNIRQLSLDRAYSTQRAAKELGFEARIKLREGLKEVVREFLSKKG